MIRRRSPQHRTDLPHRMSSDRALEKKLSLRSIALSISVASGLIGIVASINFTVDNYNILRDQTASHRIKQYIELLRSAPVGVPYTLNDRSIKMALGLSSTADCVIIGSSHTMTFRQSSNAVVSSRCGALDNLGVTGASFEDRITFLNVALSNSYIHRVFLGIDLWTLKRNSRPNWRRNTKAFAKARAVFGLPDDVYNLTQADSLIEKLGPLFSVKYLKANWRELKRAIKGKTTLDYDLRSLNEEELMLSLVLRSDGSLSYPTEYTPTPPDAEIRLVDQWTDPPFYEHDVVAEMKQAIRTLLVHGKRVTLVITPYHPKVLTCVSRQICDSIAAVEPIVREMARDLRLDVLGSFDYRDFELTRDSFIDFQHMRSGALRALKLTQ